MGMLQGRIDGDSFIIMDAFAIPAEGIETRVDPGFLSLLSLFSLSFFSFFPSLYSLFFSIHFFFFSFLFSLFSFLSLLFSKTKFV